MRVSVPAAPRPHSVRGLRTRVLHLAVLSTLAFAQPLFEALADNALFLTVRQTTPLELWALVLAALLVPAAVLAMVELGVDAFAPRAASTVHVALVGALAFLVFVPVFGSGPGWTTIAGPGAAALAIAGGYARWPSFARAASFFAPALVVTPAVFVANVPVAPWPSAGGGAAIDPDAVALAPEVVRRPLPVAVLVFDELPLVTLLDETGRLDRVRYPNFASLGDEALWVRDTTADASHTRRVLPALLTGSLPDPRRRGGDPERPTLFHLLGRTHAITASEPLLPLCPQPLCAEAAPESPVRRVGLLLRDAAVVDGWLLTPPPLRAFLTRPIDLMGAFGRAGLARAHGDASAGDVWNDPDAVTRVLDGWRPGPPDRPALRFAHLMLPHQPFVFLPSGQRYPNAGDRYYAPVESAGFALDLHRRHAAQAAYADAVLGRFLERMRALDVWDDGIVIVTADHGIGFVPGSNPRNADEHNLGDVAWVPLFVRAPGLPRGATTDRPASTVDVVPTILHLLDAPAPATIDGASVLAPPPAPRERRIVNQRGGVRAIPPSSAPLDRALARKLAHVGAGPLEDLFRTGPAAALMLRAARELPRGEPVADVEVELEGAERFDDLDAGGNRVPAVLSGTLVARRPLELAIALNGTIAAVPVVAPPRPFSSTRGFEAFLPWMRLRPGANRLEVFELDRTGGELRLRPVPVRR